MARIASRCFLSTVEGRGFAAAARRAAVEDRSSTAAPFEGYVLGPDTVVRVGVRIGSKMKTNQAPNQKTRGLSHIPTLVRGSDICPDLRTSIGVEIVAAIRR